MQGSGVDTYTGGFTNPTVVYGSTGCVGCTDTSNSGYTYTSTYVPPTIQNVTTPAYSYTPSYSYTPTYSYTPSASVTNVTTGNYGYTGGYTYPTVTGTTGSTGWVAPTVMCSNGTYPVAGVGCPTTVTIARCSDGSYPVNNTCNTVTTIPSTNTTVCSDGLPMVNNTCNRTNTIPTTVTTRCSDGSYPVNNTCSITNTIPTTITVMCSDGLARNYDGSCTRTNTILALQVCFDGTRIPTTQTCPSQYKMCANGTYILNSQSCYVAPVPVFVPPTVVKFNNVVTSVVTQITNTSARCNGIGLIANGAQSTGWFEYGETANLGRNTATASIGNTSSAPFSNVLANLKPTTKYYCRAVMQNQYGVVKGEIVSFVTKSTVVTYVKPIVTPIKKVTTVKKTTTKKVEAVCVEGSYVSVKGESSATLLAQGDKLVSLRIEKLEAKVSANALASYKVTYKNLSSSNLSGVVVRVVIPTEVKFTAASAGNYDENTHTLTLNQDMLEASSEGVIAISGKIVEDAPVGKTIVTTAYVSYTVPNTHTEDEVTAYIVSSITPVDSISNLDTGAKKVVGASDRGFMPSNLIEWLALVAIMFIVFILGRSIYLSYKEDKGEVSGH
jgi:hypothetical protein